MSVNRHATINEMVADVKAVLVNLHKFAGVLSCDATRLRELIQEIGSVAQLPAAVIVVGPADYPEDSPYAKDRYLELGVVVISEYSAETDAGGSEVWDRLDAVDRAFTPAYGEAAYLKINGVDYEPAGSTPMDAGNGRSAYMLSLVAKDCVQERDDVE